MTNDDVTDLFSRVGVGTKVVVLPMRQTVQANTKALPQMRLEGPRVIRASELY
jgi:hypothetical protein